MSDTHGKDSSGEFLWFATLLLAVLAFAAGNPTGPTTASEPLTAAAP